MRKKNLGSRIVKKAITWAMVVMMSFSGAMSGFASMTVYAEEESESTEDDGEDNQENENANESTVTTYYDENGTKVSDASQAAVEVNVTTETEAAYQLDGKSVSAEEVSNETLYEVNKETTVETETHYIVTDENGEAVAGTQNGEAVDKIEVSEEYTETEVKVVEKTEEGNTIQEKVADDATFYKQDAEGNFVKVTNDAPAGEGEQLYILAEDGTTYQNVITTYEVTTSDGDTVVIDETVKEVLTTGVANDGYTREEVYVVQVDDAEGNKETVLTITQEALKADQEKEPEEQQYIVGDDGTVSVKVEKVENIIAASDSFNDYDVTDCSYTVTKIWGQRHSYSVTFSNGVTGTVDERQVVKSWDCWEGITYSLKEGVIAHTDASTEISYQIPNDEGGWTSVTDSENIVAKTLYQVTNGKDVTVTVEPSVINSISEKNYVRVKDGVELTYTDKDNNAQTVLFTADEWKVLTSVDATVTEKTTYYYTANPEYVTGECEMKIDGKDYLLTVKFLDNSDKITVKKDENGHAIASYSYDTSTGEVTITVEYTYLDGEGKEQNGIYSKAMSLEDFKAAFDKSRMATLTIQYVPTTISGQEFVLGDITAGSSEEIGGEEEETQENAGIIYAKTETDANGNVINVPVNKGNNKTFHHVDIKVNTNVTVNGISDVKVTSATVKNSNGEVLGTSQKATSDITGTEFRLNPNIKLPGNQVLTFEIELEYLDKDGQKQTLTYVMAIYPTSDSTYNYCIDRNNTKNAGFDLFVSDKLVTQAIKEHVESKKETTVTKVEAGSRPVESTVTLNTDEDATKSLIAQLITAGVFVRSDGIQQAEDGTTHYASSDYSKDLSGLYGAVLKEGAYDLDKIYLAYTKSGLLVNEENLAELSGKTDEEIAALSVSERNALITELIIERLSDGNSNGNSEDNDLTLLAKKYIDEVKTAELRQAALEQVAKELGIEIKETDGILTYTAAGSTYENLNAAIIAQTEYLKTKASTEALDNAVKKAMNSLEGLKIKEQFIIKGEDGEDITADTVDGLKQRILDIAKSNQKTVYTYQYDGNEVEADSEDSLKKLVLDKVLDSATEEYVIHYTFADGEPKTYSAGNADEAVSALLKDVEANAQVDGSGRARLQLAGGAYTEYFASIDALKAYVESVAKDTTNAIPVYHFDGHDYDNLDAVKAELEKKFDPKESVTYVFDNEEEKNLDDLWDTIKSKLRKEEVEGYEFNGEFYAKSDKEALEALRSAISAALTNRLNAANIGLTFTVDGTDYDDVETAIKDYTDILIASQNIEWYVLKTENDGYHIDGVYRVNNNVAFGHNTSVFNALDTEISIFGSKKTTVDLSLVAVEKHIVNQSKLGYTTSYQWGFELAQASPAPSSEPTPGGEVTPDVTPDDGGDTPVIIPDTPVALAAAPVAADNGAAVLGARRTDGDAAEAAVLGARRGTEQAVLGKRRKPQTGDSAALNAWMAAMTMAAGAAGISGTKLAKGKKKEEKED